MVRPSVARIRDSTPLGGDTLLDLRPQLSLGENPARPIHDPPAGVQEDGARHAADAVEPQRRIVDGVGSRIGDQERVEELARILAGAERCEAPDVDADHQHSARVGVGDPLERGLLRPARGQRPAHKLRTIVRPCRKATAKRVSAQPSSASP